MLLYGVLCVCVLSKGYADFAVVVGEHKERWGRNVKRNLWSGPTLYFSHKHKMRTGGD